MAEGSNCIVLDNTIGWGRRVSATLEFCYRKYFAGSRLIAALTKIRGNRGGHFVSEDSPDETGMAIAGWLKKLLS